MVQKTGVKPKLIVIGGPTAVGKTAFSIECARLFNGEIVSADSMQIYKGMNVGTGKVTEKEKKGIPHHMLDILQPDAPYSVGAYITTAESVIQDIISRNKLPIVVGGTGLYINALINGMNFSDAEKSIEIREKWQNLASEHGNQYIYGKLKEIDSISADKISVNDTKRIIRALEIYEVTGKPKSQNATTHESKYDYLFFILNEQRDKLYEKINARVDKMRDGLITEALKLRQYEGCQSMQAIGYKQLFEFYNGKFANINDVFDEIKKLTRNYAKRQLTFFRSIKADKVWITQNEISSAYEQIKLFLDDKEILCK